MAGIQACTAALTVPRLPSATEPCCVACAEAAVHLAAVTSRRLPDMAAQMLFTSGLGFSMLGAKRFCSPLITASTSAMGAVCVLISPASALLTCSKLTAHVP